MEVFAYLSGRILLQIFFILRNLVNPTHFPSGRRFHMIYKIFQDEQDITSASWQARDERRR